MTKKVLKSLAIVAVGSVMTVGVASAALITGEISIVGGLELADNTDLSDAKGVNFTGGDDDSGTFYVVDVTGDFSGIAYGTIGTIYDFSFTDSGVLLWEVDGFTFTLQTISIDDQSSTDLDLSGTGYLSGDGYDVTPGVWNFSGQTTTGATFSWSSTNSAVPEPATLLLFGTGIAGLAGFSRRQKD